MVNPGGVIRSLAFSPDGKILAAGYEDNTVILWNIESGQPIGEPLMGHAFAVWSLAFSPDSKILASGSLDTSVVLWDVKTRKPIGAPLRRHTLDVLSIAFSPDGKTLASGSEDNSIILWDVETGQAMGQPLRGHTDSVWSVAFSPDGKRLASGGYDTYIVLWDVDPESLIQKACQRVRRNFIQSQWAQYFPAEEYRKTCEEFPKHPSYYRDFVEQILIDSGEPQPVQRALAEVQQEMEMDGLIKDPAAKSSKIVRETLTAGIWRELNNHKWEEVLSLMDQAKVNDISLEPLLTDTDFVYSLCWDGSLDGYATQVLDYCERAVDLSSDEDYTEAPYLRDWASTLAGEPSAANDLYLLMDICWDGTLEGYAARVLAYCERAVDLAPDDPDVHEYRGLARALTGDLAGAVEDFQFYIDFYVDEGGDESLIQERQKWIADLKAGTNPFTYKVINQLRNR
jgi:hypothetical protein